MVLTVAAMVITVASQTCKRRRVGWQSAFNPCAFSPKGAQGLMQLMPQTASSLGVLNAFPKQNIEGGVRHLRYLIDRYPGNLPLEPVPGYPALRRDAGLRAQGPPVLEALSWNR